MSAVVKRYVTGAYTECFQFADKNLTLKSSWESKYSFRDDVLKVEVNMN